MLAKKYRISKKKDFDYIFKNCSTYRGNYLTLKIAPNVNDISRFAIIVSKKVSNKATTRNLAKRRIKGIIAKLMERMTNSLNVIIIVRSFSKDLTSVEIQSDLESLLYKAKILKRNV